MCASHISVWLVNILQRNPGSSCLDSMLHCLTIYCLHIRNGLLSFIWGFLRFKTILMGLCKTISYHWLALKPRICKYVTRLKCHNHSMLRNFGLDAFIRVLWCLYSTFVGITVTSHDHHGFSNHQQMDCPFNNLFKLQPKNQKSVLLDHLCRETTRLVVSPHRGPVTWNVFSHHDVIMCIWVCEIHRFLSYSTSVYTWEYLSRYVTLI